LAGGVFAFNVDHALIGCDFAGFDQQLAFGNFGENTNLKDLDSDPCFVGSFIARRAENHPGAGRLTVIIGHRIATNSVEIFYSPYTFAGSFRHLPLIYKTFIFLAQSLLGVYPFIKICKGSP
jgi:hypothetical protein